MAWPRVPPTGRWTSGSWRTATAPGLAAAVQEVAAREGRAAPVGIAGAIAWRAVTAGDWKTSTHPEFIADSSRSLVVDGGPCSPDPRRRGRVHEPRLRRGPHGQVPRLRRRPRDVRLPRHPARPLVHPRGDRGPAAAPDDPARDPDVAPLAAQRRRGHGGRRRQVDRVDRHALRQRRPRRPAHPGGARPDPQALAGRPLVGAAHLVLRTTGRRCRAASRAPSRARWPTATTTTPSRASSRRCSPATGSRPCSGGVRAGGRRSASPRGDADLRDTHGAPTWRRWSEDPTIITA